MSGRLFTIAIGTTIQRPQDSSVRIRLGGRVGRRMRMHTSMVIRSHCTTPLACGAQASVDIWLSAGSSLSMETVQPGRFRTSPGLGGAVASVQVAELASIQTAHLQAKAMAVRLLPLVASRRRVLAGALFPQALVLPTAWNLTSPAPQDFRDSAGGLIEDRAVALLPVFRVMVLEVLPAQQSASR